MIDTINEKLAMMELEQVYEPGLPISPGGIDQPDQRQLLWGYPGLTYADVSAALEPAYSRDHAQDVFYAPQWVYAYPTLFTAPEIVPYLVESIVDDEACFLRRPEGEHACLRRSDEDELALRRAPECPDQFACPTSGCV